jgi:hypothetical protein
MLGRIGITLSMLGLLRSEGIDTSYKNEKHAFLCHQRAHRGELLGDMCASSSHLAGACGLLPGLVFLRRGTANAITGCPVTEAVSSTIYVPLGCHGTF